MDLEAKIRAVLGDGPPEDECVRRLVALFATEAAKPIPMIIHCPACGLQHVDGAETPDEASAPHWHNPPHRTHLCHGCGWRFRTADVPTNGVRAVLTTGQSDSPAVPAANREAYYDAYFAPVLMRLARVCEATGMSMVALVEFEQGGLGETVCLMPGSSYALRLARAAVAARGNVDSLVEAIVRHAQERGHDSIHLAAIGIPPKPPGYTS